MHRTLEWLQELNEKSKDYEDDNKNKDDNNIDDDDDDDDDDNDDDDNDDKEKSFFRYDGVDTPFGRWTWHKWAQTIFNSFEKRYFVPVEVRLRSIDRNN